VFAGVVQIVAEVHTLQLVAHAAATTDPEAKKYPVFTVVQVFALEQAEQLGHATGVPAVPLTNAKLAAAVVQVAAAEQAEHPVIAH